MLEIDRVLQIFVDVPDALYRRADWNWACNGGATLTHGWSPEAGFLPYRYQGYGEGLLLYLLALGSPTHPIPADSYNAYCATYQWKEIYGRELLYSGALFTHQDVLVRRRRVVC